MKVISIINLKGGVGKTTSVINIGYILSVIHNKRVLLVDNDKQANLSKFFCLTCAADSESLKGISEIISGEITDIRQAIHETQYDNLDIILSNMRLLGIMQNVLEDETSSQHTRLKEALDQVKEDYDYCIIDNPPDVNISVINALIATDDVIIPVRSEYFSFCGIDEILQRIDLAKDYNPSINFKGCLITMYQKNNVNKQAKEMLQNAYNYPVFETVIRNSIKVSEMTFTGVPLLKYAKKCTTTQDYITFVEEYLSK